jgi:hypothetical protein
MLLLLWPMLVALGCAGGSGVGEWGPRAQAPSEGTLQGAGSRATRSSGGAGGGELGRPSSGALPSVAAASDGGWRRTRLRLLRDRTR